MNEYYVGNIYIYAIQCIFCTYKCKVHTNKSNILIYELNVFCVTCVLTIVKQERYRVFLYYFTKLYLIANAVDFLGYARVFTCE